MQTRRYVYFLVLVPSEDIISWLNQNIQLVCVECESADLVTCQWSLSLIIICGTWKTPVILVYLQPGTNDGAGSIYVVLSV